MKALPLVAVSALVLVSSSSSAVDFTLRPVARTATTVTLTWKRQSGADGYAFLRNGVPVARTLDPSQTRATFWKGSTSLRGGCPSCFRRRTSHARRTRGLSRRRRARRRRRALVANHQRLDSCWCPPPALCSPSVSSGVHRRPLPSPGNHNRAPNGYRFVSEREDRLRRLSSARSPGSRSGRVPTMRSRCFALAPGRRAVPLWSAKVFVTSRVGRTHATGSRSRLVFVPARKIDFRLRLVGRTSRALTFGWKRQPTVDGYRFIRNGKVVSPRRSTVP